MGKEKSEFDAAVECLEYIDSMEEMLGDSYQVIDLLIRMVRRAAASTTEAFLTSDNVEWLDALQKHAQEMIDEISPAEEITEENRWDIFV